ncbi:hypothetical protein OSTOST_10277, partial [Ostertagia ostertagi]
LLFATGERICTRECSLISVRSGFQFVTETSYCYQISSKLYSAADAASYCGTQGAQLASLVLQAEMTALLKPPVADASSSRLRVKIAGKKRRS